VNRVVRTGPSGPSGPSGAPAAGSRVVVVGAGVAGLTAARDLARAGHRVTVLEAGPAPGGSIAGHEVAGLRLDAGAESYATRSPVVADLVAELGLADDVVAPAPAGAWVHLPDRTVPLPRTGMLGIPGDPWALDVRRAVGTLGALRAGLDRVLPRRVGAGAPDLGTLVRRRMGHRVLDRLVAPVVEGVHAAHPDQVEVLPGILPGLRRTGSLAGAVAQMRAAAPAGSAVHGLHGGLHRLVDALLQDLHDRGVEVRTSAPVVALARVPAGSWEVRTDDGVLAAERVLLAVPGRTAQELLGPVLARLPAPADEAFGPELAPVPEPVVLVTLVVDEPALDAAPRGTGVLVATGAPGVRAKALTHVTAKWRWVAEAAGPGRHVVRLSYGRPGEGPPPVDLATALADASTLLGVPLHGERLVGHAVTTWTTGLPRPRPGHAARVAGVREALAGTGLEVCGAWAAGTGLVAVVGDARAAAARLVAD
jgi:oxygen-dependent protoporphyrinogen oxidase